MSNPSINREKWSVIRFDQMAECLTVRVEPSETTLERYVGLEHLDPETLKISRWGTPSDVIGEKLHFWPGDIIFGKRRAYQKKLAVADFEGICSAHAMVLRARPEIVLPEFLPFFMQSDLFFERALSISVGSLSPTINWGTLAKQEFPLPPLDEQRRIAEILWAADEVITKNLVTLQRIISLKDSVEEESYFRCRESGQPALLSEIAEVNPSSKSNCKDDELVSFVTMADVSEDGEIINQQSKMYREVKKGYTVFQDGDILFAKITPCMENGKGALAQNLINGIGFGSTEFHVLRPMDSRDTAYIYFLIMNKKFRQQARRFMRGTAGQLRVPKDFLDEYVIDCLPKVSIREEIGRKLIEINSSFLEQKRSIEKAKNVKAELLQKLLGGQ
jgi:type I restriction enzyme S subunit